MQCLMIILVHFLATELTFQFDEELVPTYEYMYDSMSRLNLMPNRPQSAHATPSSDQTDSASDAAFSSSVPTMHSTEMPFQDNLPVDEEVQFEANILRWRQIGSKLRRISDSYENFLHNNAAVVDAVAAGPLSNGHAPSVPMVPNMAPGRCESFQCWLVSTIKQYCLRHLESIFDWVLQRVLHWTVPHRR